MTFLPFTYRKYTVVPNWVWVVREKWHAGPHLNKEFGLEWHGGVISGFKFYNGISGTWRLKNQLCWANLSLIKTKLRCGLGIKTWDWSVRWRCTASQYKWGLGKPAKKISEEQKKNRRSNEEEGFRDTSQFGHANAVLWWCSSTYIFYFHFTTYHELWCWLTAEL